MVLDVNDPWMAAGVYYNFNWALNKDQIFEVPDYEESFSRDDYQYKWFVASDYIDVNSKEGLLTITQPLLNKDGYAYGVYDNQGFLLKGPAIDTLYVPMHVGGNDNNSTRTASGYSGTNYFRAGTGKVVPRERNGLRNFYYTDPSGFWECNNIVIPKGKAYLALPASMTANIKKLNCVIEDDDEVTGITHLTMDENGDIVPVGGENDAWYTLSGLKLTAKPTEKGIYIHNSKKEIIK